MVESLMLLSGCRSLNVFEKEREREREEKKTPGNPKKEAHKWKKLRLHFNYLVPQSYDRTSLLNQR
jgi:hypothetical protein